MGNIHENQAEILVEWNVEEHGRVHEELQKMSKVLHSGRVG